MKNLFLIILISALVVFFFMITFCKQESVNASSGEVNNYQVTSFADGYIVIIDTRNGNVVSTKKYFGGHWVE